MCEEAHQLSYFASDQIVKASWYQCWKLVVEQLGKKLSKKMRAICAIKNNFTTI